MKKSASLKIATSTPPDAHPAMEEAIGFVSENLNRKKVLTPEKYLAAMKNQAAQHMADSLRDFPQATFQQVLTAFLNKIPHFVQADLVMSVIQHMHDLWQKRKVQTEVFAKNTPAEKKALAA